MVDVLMVVVIVAFFVAAALLVRVLGRVTDEASVEREPDFPEAVDVPADQRPAVLPDGRK
jgi:hypothetical protein